MHSNMASKKAGGSPRESDENNQQGNKHDKRDIAQTVKGSDLLLVEKINEQEHEHVLIGNRGDIDAQEGKG